MIARGRPVLLAGDPVVHAMWLDDAETNDGYAVVVVVCGESIDANPSLVTEVERPVDCMACLVHPRREFLREEG